MENFESIYIEFVVIDETLKPNDITNNLGITPTKTWLKGDVLAGTRVPQKENGWKLKIDLDTEIYDVGETIDRLLKQLYPKKKYINSLVQSGYYVAFNCVLNLQDKAPAFSLNPNTIRQIADLGVEVDVDIILYS